ncbi:hypothetical protein GCM10027053_35000 [Intrasporangium mesophilum]
MEAVEGVSDLEHAAAPRLIASAPVSATMRVVMVFMCVEFPVRMAPGWFGRATLGRAGNPYTLTASAETALAPLDELAQPAGIPKGPPYAAGCGRSQGGVGHTPGSVARRDEDLPSRLTEQALSCCAPTCVAADVAPGDTP